MEDFIRREFDAKTLQCLGKASGGCISDGESFDIDNGRLKVFVKYNKDEKAKIMFDGEYSGLKKIIETKTVRVPCPNKVLSYSAEGEWIFIMEYIKMTSLRTHMKQLGHDLARLHLFNLSLESKDSSSIHASPQSDDSSYVDKFGFECTTCCGYIPMCNEWESNWTNFYARHRLKPQIDLVMQKYGNRQLLEYWPQLERKLPSYFEGVKVRPSLLHGDLWSGNAAETDNGPVVFDPAAFYGHDEFDLSITNMFGGFSQLFYESYHSLIPKSPGFEARQNLYLLFHNLNHWNHFGSSYQHQSLQLMKNLL